MHMDAGKKGRFWGKLWIAARLSSEEQDEEEEVLVVAVAVEGVRAGGGSPLTRKSRSKMNQFFRVHGVDENKFKTKILRYYSTPR
jgi:hypothetical protein